MIGIYCRHKEHNKTLCKNCRELESYAHRRLDCCRYGEKKRACKNCTTHCYAPKQRELIRKVMRFSGPRMIIYSPLEAIRHLLLSKI